MLQAEENEYLRRKARYQEATVRHGNVTARSCGRVTDCRCRAVPCRSGRFRVLAPIRSWSPS